MNMPAGLLDEMNNVIKQENREHQRAQRKARAKGRHR